MGQIITDVGIDLDGVIYPFATAFREYCERHRGLVNLTDPTHWNFYEDWGLDEENFHAWLTEAARDHKVFATHDPYDGVENAWRDLRDMGVKIHVLTARPQSAWSQTAEWLTKHNLHADSLHFGPTKSLLAKIATGKSILIDDHVVYYEEAERNGIVPCLMDRAWNAHKVDANRVSSLPEFVSFIRGYNSRPPMAVQVNATVTRPSQIKAPNPYIKKENPWKQNHPEPRY